MPKSKHRKKKGKGRARTPAQGGAARARIERDDILTAIVVLMVRKCRELFGDEPPERYSDEQMKTAFRQLQNEGLLPRHF
jgi:hypothetical protein